MKKALIKKNKKWLTAIYKLSTYQHLTMGDEINFQKATNRKRNVIRVEKRHRSFVDWDNIKFHEGYATVQCYDWKGKFAYDFFIYSQSQLPVLLMPYWKSSKYELHPYDIKN